MKNMRTAMFQVENLAITDFQPGTLPSSYFSDHSSAQASHAWMWPLPGLHRRSESVWCWWDYHMPGIWLASSSKCNCTYVKSHQFCSWYAYMADSACCAASALLDITKHRLVHGLLFQLHNAGRGRAMHAASSMFTYNLLICADS